MAAVAHNVPSDLTVAKQSVEVAIRVMDRQNDPTSQF